MRSIPLVTRSENARRGLTGQHPKVALRRLTPEEVAVIRRSQDSNRTLGVRFGVSRETIRTARSGKHYAEVGQ